MCSSTPRFSYGTLKTAVDAALLAACSTACTGGGYRVGIPGGYLGGYTGRVIRDPAAKDVPTLSGGQTAKRAPEGSCREPGVGGLAAAPQGRPHPTPAGPGRPLASLGAPRADSRLLANRGEIPPHFM